MKLALLLTFLKMILIMDLTLMILSLLLRRREKRKFFIFTEKYKGSLSDYVPITPDKTEKAQKAQELERIQQEQKQQEYFLNKVAEEINRFLNKQANLAEFDEQRAREMQELDRQARQMHSDTRPEILGY